MGIIGAMKKGLEVAAKSLLLCLAAMVILFIGYVIIGALLGVTMGATQFPTNITPGMTTEQINALPWAAVKWHLFIPSALAILLLGFLLNAFTQSGIVGTVKDYITEGKEKILNFFKHGAKYILKFFFQILLVVLITIACVIIALLAMTLVALIKIPAIVMPISIVIFLVLMAALIYIAMTLVYGQIHIVFNNSKPLEALGGAIKFINKNFLKTALLFILAGIIYVAFYLLISYLTSLTFGWGIASQIIWNLASSYMYMLVSVFMLGSFTAFYSATASNQVK